MKWKNVCQSIISLCTIGTKAFLTCFVSLVCNILDCALINLENQRVQLYLHTYFLFSHIYDLSKNREKLQVYAAALNVYRYNYSWFITFTFSLIILDHWLRIKFIDGWTDSPVVARTCNSHNCNREPGFGSRHPH